MQKKRVQSAELRGNEKISCFCLFEDDTKKEEERKVKMSIAYRYSIVYVDEYNSFRSAQTGKCWIQITLNTTFDGKKGK